MAETRFWLEDSSQSKTYSFGTTAASGEGLVTINKGTAATSTVVLDAKGSVNIGGDLNLIGNLNITGSINEQSVTNLQVSDINITLNKGGTTAGAAGAGLFIEGDSAATIGKLLFDNTLTSKWKLGDGTTQLEVVTVSGAQTLTNKTIAGTQITGNITGNAANVTGTVLVANGGTGVATLTGLVKGNGTSAFSAAVVGTDYSVGTAALGTGILKSTTGTGVLSIAVAADFPTLNQNTSGSAGSVANSLTINNSGSGAASGASFNGASAVTISYNTLGAAPLASPTFTGTVTIPTGSSITLPNFSTNAGVAAAGSTQGTATALTNDINVITTVAASTGVVLPATTAGKKVTVVNKGANILSVYPAASSAIDSLGSNIAITIPVGGVLEFVGASTTQWYSAANSVVSGSYVSGNITGSAGSVANALTIDSTLISGGSTYNGSVAKSIGIQTGAVTNAMLAGSIDLTSKVTGILPAANGGTGNGFTVFSGATTSTKTYTLPNASVTILTDNAAVTVAQGGTGIQTTTAYGVIHAGTTATGIFQNSGTPGTSGWVYTSNGPTALPSWQAPTGSASYPHWTTVSGTIDGVNKIFTIGNSLTAGSEIVVLDGVTLDSGSSNDYILSGTTLTFQAARTAPRVGAKIKVYGIF